MKYINESFESFVNEAKKKKKKQSSGISKGDIANALKAAGFENVSMIVNSFKSASYKPLTKGLRGGSIGPMTATDAYRNRNREVVERLEKSLWNFTGSKAREREYETYDLVWRFPAGKKDLIYKFMWSLYPSNSGRDLDPGYQTYWLTYVVDEVVPVEEKFDAEAWDSMMSEWTKDMLKFLDGKKLGRLELENIRSEFDGIIEFQVKVDELQLDWMIKNDTRNLNSKKEVYIGISSPNKRGTFEKTVSGRNAENKGVWDKVEDIYNNAYKYKR